MTGEQLPKDEDFAAGDRVRYVPRHAHGNMEHPDCEDGRVTSTNDDYVFVRFGCGDTSAACERDQLRHLR